MKAFILLLLHCAAFLTNVEFGGARKSRILYYVRGLGGGYPFSYGVGLGSSIGLSPSTTIPLPAAYADGVENLRVSTLSHGQNAGLVKTLPSTVTNSGAGKLDDASAPSVAFSSSTNTSVGLIENPFHLRVGILHKKVLSGGTKSTQTKSSGRNAPSVSTITSLGSIKSPDESPGGVGSRSFVMRSFLQVVSLSISSNHLQVTLVPTKHRYPPEVLLCLSEQRPPKKWKIITR
uniref:Putative secreted protein n=1 Tax=Rhipicephalus microplus TaxID=6941 RepID=A0A6G5A4Q2_RHIMP